MNEKIIINEFYKDIIKFEGEYINGKLNGKGKQYFFGQLIFAGDYMDGIKNGFERNIILMGY